MNIFENYLSKINEIVLDNKNTLKISRHIYMEKIKIFLRKYLIKKLKMRILVI